jgi:toxin-antitoxin system PIN domain toxin
MIAVVINILLVAHRQASPWHRAADLAITELAESGRNWAIAWPGLHEFVAIATHPRIFQPPSSLAQACEQVGCWLESPSLVLIAEESGYWQVLEQLLGRSRTVGPEVHDARLAAVCQLHGVGELWTADRDFSRYPGLRTRNPVLPG